MVIPHSSRVVDAVLELDRQRRELLVQTEAIKAERNAATEEVARRKRAKEPADELMARLKASGEEVKRLDASLREIETALETQALGIPNFPAAGDSGRRRVGQSRTAVVG